MHASNADDNGASEMSAQGHERRIPCFRSAVGALDIPMGGGRRHGRAGSYDARRFRYRTMNSSRDLYESRNR